jgi:hypothetical protein
MSASVEIRDGPLLSVRAMRTVALLALAGTLCGCDAAINAGVSLGSQIIVEGIGAVVRSNAKPDYLRSPGTSHLVCNPVGEKVVDPTTECHSDTSDQ